MKKLCVFFILFSLALLSFNFCSRQNVYAIGDARLIEVVAIADRDSIGTASLYGRGETFVTDLKLKVEFRDYAPYEIIVQDGYSPNIETFDFGAENKFLFFSSQTGGSGGYGNYMIFDLKVDSYSIVYDELIDSEKSTFSAEFKPNGFMNVTDNTTSNSLDVNVGYMDEYYYNLIFDINGKVIGEQPYVNDISFISPAFNPASNIYRLLTYRSVVAVAEVNRLGYIVQTLDFNGEKFEPTFTEFSIAL